MTDTNNHQEIRRVERLSNELWAEHRDCPRCKIPKGHICRSLDCVQNQNVPLSVLNNSSTVKYDAPDISPPLTNALESLRSTVAFSTRDWSLLDRDAWIYGILFGWNPESLKRVAAQHRWSPETVERLQTLREQMIDRFKDVP